MAPSPRSLWLAFAAALLGLMPSTAVAVVPNVVDLPVVGNPSFNGVVNTMMYTVTVTVDDGANDRDHDATVGFTDSYTSCNDATTVWKWAPVQRFTTTDPRTWTLYNFQPGATYHYKVRLGGGGARPKLVCGELTTTDVPTPTIPTDLANLNLEFHKAGESNPFYTKYVVMETGDCGAGPLGRFGDTDYILAVDPENETIVWYLDLPAVTGVPGADTNGWRYQPGPTATSGRILVLVEHRYFFELGFDGTVTNSYDFAPGGECDSLVGSAGPCLHHDAFRSDEPNGRTYVLASAQSERDGVGTEWDHCGTDARFVNDGIATISRSGTMVGAKYLMDDYGFDPDVYGGPNAATVAAFARACNGITYTFDFEYGAIDWTHSNTITASNFGPLGEVLDLSLKEWDAVLRFRAATGEHVSTLASNPDISDWALETDVEGPAAFQAQHDVHEIALNQLLMYDNLGDPVGARVLRLATDLSTWTATIDRSWVLVDEAGDPLSCPVEGSGQLVPDSDGEHVLANCNDETTIVELSDWTGSTGAAPPLVISLPDTDWCAAGGPDDRENIIGWHKAFPAASIGEF